MCVFHNKKTQKNKNIFFKCSKSCILKKTQNPCFGRNVAATGERERERGEGRGGGGKGRRREDEEGFGGVSMFGSVWERFGGLGELGS